MRKLFRFVVAVVGLGIGIGLAALILHTIKFPGQQYVMRYTTISAVLISVYVIVGLLFGLIFYFASPRIINGVNSFFKGFESRLSAMPALDILFGVIGIMIGILFAFLLSFIVQTINVPILPNVITLLLYIFCGYYGGRIGVTRRPELMNGGKGRIVSAIVPDGARPKVLDTSVIIDGRIYDICRTGFVEGVIVVPAFVLKELRHIADSSDSVKRARGRRGLDILQSMQEELNLQVRIEERNYEDIDEVDLKLLRLADDLGGALVTNDYNLNKVAAVQKTPVLNINDLANAIRPVLLPGENMTLMIIKEGKEQGQGVGYLADGTLVIVEGGKKHMGETVELTVTSALQTSAGRMIFAKLK